MSFFPQLSTGAVAQFPIVRTLRRPATVSLLQDSSRLISPDPEIYTNEWLLTYSGLTDDERSLLEAFFADREGSLRTFLFPDPAANLLLWSEDAGQSAWSADPLLQVESSGGTTTLANTGQVAQALRQTVPLPAAYTCCFSASVRAEVAAGVTLSIEAEGSVVQREVQAGPVWRTAFVSHVSGGSAPLITCAIAVGPGESVALRDLNLAAQPMPGRYQRTLSGSAVYGQARFAQDTLSFRADGPGSHSTALRIVSSAQGL